MKIKDVASSLRLDIIKMSNRAKAPHLASSLSCIDIVITLYEKVLKIFPKRPKIQQEIDLFLAKVMRQLHYMLHWLTKVFQKKIF